MLRTTRRTARCERENYAVPIEAVTAHGLKNGKKVQLPRIELGTSRV